ncbi:MAG: hypothetical protein D6714_04620 [Bacteroidetes bacterium]|nr:MAG: hypothetical protein D6714_04620 [Bacteroidota bacterium]
MLTLVASPFASARLFLFDESDDGTKTGRGGFGFRHVEPAFRYFFPKKTCPIRLNGVPVG